MAERSVGIREMNQNAGRLIRQVASSGEEVTVTDRGVPIARLAPISPRSSRIARLRESGRVRAASATIDDVPRRPWTGPGTSLDALAELRGDH